MSEILLYIDEDSMDERFVRALRARNVDVLTVADVGMLHRSDEEQLDWARQNRRTIFTFNVKDFYQLHTAYIQQDLSHAGIIVAHQQRHSIGSLMRGVLKLLGNKSAEDIEGEMVFLSKWIE